MTTIQNINSILPEEILFNIFSYCKEKELRSSSIVCKQWNYLASDEQLWKIVYPELVNLCANKNISIKEFIVDKEIVETFEELYRRVNSILEKAGLFQKYEISCQFANHPNSYIKIAFGDVLTQQEAVENKTFVFINPLTDQSNSYQQNPAFNTGGDDRINCKLEYFLPELDFSKLHQVRSRLTADLNKHLKHVQALDQKPARCSSATKAVVITAIAVVLLYLKYSSGNDKT